MVQNDKIQLPKKRPFVTPAPPRIFDGPDGMFYSFKYGVVTNLIGIYQFSGYRFLTKDYANPGYKPLLLFIARYRTTWIHGMRPPVRSPKLFAVDDDGDGYWSIGSKSKTWNIRTLLEQDYWIQKTSRTTLCTDVLDAVSPMIKRFGSKINE